METVTFLDTHALIWLYAGEIERFSLATRKKLESESLVISPIALLEAQYLYELKRITAAPLPMLAELEKSLGLTVHAGDFESVVLSALTQSWTRDPFDRIIVAQASELSAPLLTKDRTILKNYSQAFWD